MDLQEPTKSSTTKIGEYVPCGYSTLTIWAFVTIEKVCIKKIV